MRIFVVWQYCYHTPRPFMVSVKRYLRPETISFDTVKSWLLAEYFWWKPNVSTYISQWKTNRMANIEDNKMMEEEMGQDKKEEVQETTWPGYRSRTFNSLPARLRQRNMLYCWCRHPLKQPRVVSSGKIWLPFGLWFSSFTEAGSVSSFGRLCSFTTNFRPWSVKFSLGGYVLNEAEFMPDTWTPPVDPRRWLPPWLPESGL